jgi:hypothetical protein
MTVGSESAVPVSVRLAAQALDRRPIAWHSPPFGLSAAQRHVLCFDDGSSAFVKGATDRQTAGWLRTEHRLLGLVGGQLGPSVLAWVDDGERPVLVTTDLSDAYWPAASGVTVWRPGDIDAVFAALERLRGFAGLAGADLAPTSSWPTPAWRGLLAHDGLVRAGLCSAGWLERNGPRIAAADDRATAKTDCLVHGDVRSDNLCLLADGSVRFVDWSHAGAGGRFHDLVSVLPTLRLEGGPVPATVLREPVEPIVRLCGATVRRAVGDEPMPDWLREVFARLAAIDLAWVATVLGLEPPDGHRQEG